MSVYDTPVYDKDIFYKLPEPTKNRNNNILSMSVYDKPVYDEDIFYELPVLMSNIFRCRSMTMRSTMRLKEETTSWQRSTECCRNTSFSTFDPAQLLLRPHGSFKSTGSLLPIF